MGKNSRDFVSKQQVDHYRRQIGKEDSKKLKKELKVSKKNDTLNENIKQKYMVKDTALMVTTIVLVLFSVYVLFYFLLMKNSV